MRVDRVYIGQKTGGHMTREQLAMKIFDMLEESYPAIIHTFDPEHEDHIYDSDDLELLADKIVRICNPWSRLKSLHGDYDKPLSAEEIELLTADLR